MSPQLEGDAQDALASHGSTGAAAAPSARAAAACGPPQIRPLTPLHLAHRAVMAWPRIGHAPLWDLDKLYSKGWLARPVWAILWLYEYLFYKNR